jgi:hypothetical protein
VLDLYDVRAPVGQDRARGGHERKLCHFQDSYALHHLRHTHPLVASSGTSTIRLRTSRSQTGKCFENLKDPPTKSVADGPQRRTPAGETAAKILK